MANGFDPTQAPAAAPAAPTASAPAGGTTLPKPGATTGGPTMAPPVDDADLQRRKQGWTSALGAMMSDPQYVPILLQMAGQIIQPLQQGENAASRIFGTLGAGIGQVQGDLDAKAAAKSKSLAEQRKEARADTELMLKIQKEARESGKAKPVNVESPDGTTQAVLVTPTGDFLDANTRATVTIAPGSRIVGTGTGTSVDVTVDTGDKQPLTKTAKSDQQKKLLGAEQNIARLEGVADSFKDEFLTIWGRMKASAGGLLDRLGDAGQMLDSFASALGVDDLTEFNARRGAFKQDVDTFFNQYRKEITGAAASIRELELLKESLFSTDIGPEEFAARYGNFVNKLREGIELHKETLREGVDVGSDLQGVSDEELDRMISEAQSGNP